MSFVNPYVFTAAEYDFFNLQNADHFSSYKVAASGSIGGDITDYEFGGGNSTFNATTGEWTAGNTGLHLMTISGFPEGGKGGGERKQQLFIDGVQDSNESRTRDYNAGSGTGSSACIAFFENVTSGDVFNYDQFNSDRAEHVVFSSIYMPTSEMDGEFMAFQAIGSGSAGNVIDGFTEEFDPDGNFNPTTGIYTCANAGLHLFFATGFPQSGTSANNHGLNLQVNGALEGYEAQTPNPYSTAAVKKAGIALVDMSASDAVAWRQAGARMDEVVFGGCRLTGTSNYFSARKATETGSVGDTIAGWTEDFDVGSQFNATTGVFTAPADGVWWFTWTGEWSSSGTGDLECQMALSINSSSNALDGDYVPSREFLGNLNTGQLGHVFACPVRLRSGDTVELKQVGRTMNTCYFAGFSVDW